MFFPIKFVFYFTTSFLILSFPIGESTVFEICDSIAGPYTTKFYKTLKSYVYTGVDKSKKVSLKLLKNTSKELNDTIKSESSGLKKRIQKKVHLPQDEYTPEEREALLRILKSHK